MVCIVEDRVLLDLSIDQFQFEEWRNDGVVFHPLAATAYPRHQSIVGLPRIEVLHDDCFIRYKPLTPGEAGACNYWGSPSRAGLDDVLDELRASEPAGMRPVTGSARNAPCACGSGRKAKRCCASAPARVARWFDAQVTPLLGTTTLIPATR